MIIRHLCSHLFQHFSRFISYLAYGLLLISSTSCTTHYPAHESMEVGKQASHKNTVQRPMYAPVIAEPQPMIQAQTHQNNPMARTVETSTDVDSATTMDTPMSPSINRPIPPQINPASELNNRKLNIAEYNQTLFLASEQGNTGLINRMIEQGANVSSTNTNAETALHSAAAHNQVDAAMILIENGADVGAKTISGWTPLHSAARFGSVDVINLLMGSGSMPHLRNNDGKSAVDLARQAGHDGAVRALLVR